MKFLLSDRSLGRCDMLKAVLESNGIECLLKNEHIPFSTSGINVFGTEPVLPELWVVDDDKHEDAMELLKAMESQDPGESAGSEK